MSKTFVPVESRPCSSSCARWLFSSPSRAFPAPWLLLIWLATSAEFSEECRWQTCVWLRSAQEPGWWFRWWRHEGTGKKEEGQDTVSQPEEPVLYTNLSGSFSPSSPRRSCNKQRGFRPCDPLVLRTAPKQTERPPICLVSSLSTTAWTLSLPTLTGTRNQEPISDRTPVYLHEETKCGIKLTVYLWHQHVFVCVWGGKRGFQFKNYFYRKSQK